MVRDGVPRRVKFPQKVKQLPPCQKKTSLSNPSKPFFSESTCSRSRPVDSTIRSNSGSCSPSATILVIFVLILLVVLLVISVDEQDRLDPASDLSFAHQLVKAWKHLALIAFSSCTSYSLHFVRNWINLVQAMLLDTWFVDKVFSHNDQVLSRHWQYSHCEGWHTKLQFSSIMTNDGWWFFTEYKTFQFTIIQHIILQ